jgi:ribosome-associated heat shock protein Hsp15
MSTAEAMATEAMRLDKWLWAARFFKTRQLAVDAVNGGHVHLDGKRAKPSKEVRVGARLNIRREALEWEVTVKALPAQRRPAAEASLCYQETPESARRRQETQERLRLLAQERPAPGRPTKRDRRMIHRFVGKE